jgi:hypothetical protein
MMAGDIMTTLTETWVSEGGRIAKIGDTVEIDRLLVAELEQLGAADGGWRKLFRHRADGRLWQLDYPQSEMHGGGPRRFIELEIIDPNAWDRP